MPWCETHPGRPGVYDWELVCIIVSRRITLPPPPSWCFHAGPGIPGCGSCWWDVCACPTWCWYINGVALGVWSRCRSVAHSAGSDTTRLADLAGRPQRAPCRGSSSGCSERIRKHCSGRQQQKSCFSRLCWRCDSHRARSATFPVRATALRLPRAYYGCYQWN